MRTMSLWQFFLLFVSLLALGIAQVDVGSYPIFTSVATYRPVTSSSECGGEGVENFCQFTVDAEASLAPNCMQAVCNGTCPFGDSSPTAISLAALGTFGVGVSTVQGRPGTTTSALRFDNSSILIVASRLSQLGAGGFSFSAWINQDSENTGTLLSKSSSDALERNYVITVSASSLSLDYLPQTLAAGDTQRFRNVMVDDLTLDPSHWHLVTVTVYDVDVGFYVNGSVVAVRALEGAIENNGERNVLVGQLSPGVGSYNGLMQEISFFTRALTAREITELYTGTFPVIHLSSSCHCPPSHPLIDSANQASCIQQPGILPSRGVVERLNPLAHPPSFANDFALSRGWLSSPGQRQVNITFTLTNSLYELIFINLRYGSPRPRASVWETSRDGGVTFNPIQYFADDCMAYFGLPDDGLIVNADDVNCITTNSLQTPTFSGDVRVHFLNQERSTNFNLDTSAELRQFILASHFRVRFMDFFESSTVLAHRYYSILEASVVARCACNGHAARCGAGIDGVCECLHNTQGPNCEQCLPFYNDKPWQYGVTDNAFPCKPCDCNGHASTCHYNSTVDSFPDSYDLGGGGVCDNCRDNTAGPRCETCTVGYFSPPGSLPTDPTPCIPCGCNVNGISDTIGDCAKGQSSGGEILGQCFCKSRVAGLKCDICQVGFFNLTSANPDGCTQCNCNTAGTFNALDTCNHITGQCSCKTNVTGLRCDQCRPGTTNFTIGNVAGCEACQCDPVGTVQDSNCDPVSGVCMCKPGVGGDGCDVCLPGFFGFSESGCTQCSCLSEGSLTNICDAVTGVCMCAGNVMGDRCDACEDGFYDIAAGCISCDCNIAGTENGTSVCDKLTGVCPCKSNVDGDKCDSCLPGFSNLIGSNPDGCSECDCFELNTNLEGVICDSVTLQCECVPMATGVQCESCLNGFYQTDSGCVPCDCDASGAVSNVCEAVTGRCACRSVGVGGRSCDTCLPGFFQFPTCASCGCDPAGSVEGTVCDPVTGVCSCKQYVTGALCDSCEPGFQQLEASNPFGCSAMPDEQAPPTPTPISATSILLEWLEPEAPNGFILSYNVYRDGSLVATVTARNYTDAGLTPNTRYSYSVEATNSVGSTRSVEVEVQTLEGIPERVAPPTLTALTARSVRAAWVEPATPNGVINRYEVVMVMLGPEQTIVGEKSVFNASGEVFSAVISDLAPFTFYAFIVRACTTGGCGSSDLSEVQTLQAPPTFQPAPNVTTISSEELLVSWGTPPTPNGIISRYEVFQRDFPFTGEGISLTNTTALSFLVQGLRPFMMYEFNVASYTAGGGVLSAWMAGTTAEAAPTGVLPPTVLALSSTSFRITWAEPTSPNGIIRRYGVYQVTMGTEELVGDFSEEPGSVVLNDLSPFTEYSFLLEVCTSVDCSRSDVVTMTTLEGDPIGQPNPSVVNVNSTFVSLMWAEPAQPNGLIIDYSVQRRRSSAMPLEHDVGVAFDGTGIASFAAGIANLGGFTNEIRLMFRTLRPQGTLLFYLNQAGSDLLAIELREGVPYFVFDAGSGSGVAAPAVESGTQFSDGQWHSVVARQSGRTGSILVDGIHSGTGMSQGTDSVISSAQAIHIGGIPSSSPITTTVGGATLSRNRFAGCVFGVVLNSAVLDMSQSDPSEGVDLVDGCPVDVGPGWRLRGSGYLSLEAGLITDPNFSLTFDLYTADSAGIVFLVHSADSANALGMTIRNSTLFVVALSNDTGLREVSVGSPHSACDTQDLSVALSVSGMAISVRVSGEDPLIVTDSWSSVPLSSSMYFGGIPRESPGYSLAARMGLNVETPLSGCVRVVELVTGGVSVSVRVSESSQVTFNGCGPRRSGCVSPMDFSVGTAMSFTDTPLESFTDYLYRVSARNSVGAAVSGWVATSTLPGVAAPVPVSLVTSTANSLTLSWSRPGLTRGLITSYDITAMPISTVGLQFPLGGVSVSSLSVTQPEMVLLTTLTSLEPATSYQVVVTSFTRGGESEGLPIILSTGEAVPVNVQPPTVNLIEARRLGVTWQQPAIPNGIIVRYDLFVDDEIRFSGPENNTIVDSLSPFTEYSLHLQACTSMGCSNSSIATGQTLPDRPMGLAAPNLTALSPSSIEVRWAFPDQRNGAISRFELRQLFGPELSQFEIVFSGLGLETTITGLAPNTLYTYQLVVFNAGGSAESDIVSVVTLEGVPDGVNPPTVLVVTPTTLNVTWTPPTLPNGIITEYILLQNGTTIFSGLNFFFVVSDLQPFSFYSYSIMACTVRNCSSSAPTVVMTPEAPPTGYVPPSISRVTPYLIELAINPITTPNGIVTYLLSLNDSDIVLYNSSSPGLVAIGDLSPFTEYGFVLVVMNSAGSLVGPAFSLTTEPTAPEGLTPPTTTMLNATTFRLEWSPPSFPNGLIQSYELIIVRGDAVDVLDQGLSLVGVVSGLRPFTMYEASVRANNTVGTVVSMVTNFTTGETVPTGFDQIVPFEVGPRYVVLSWDEPAAVNGILVNYTVLTGGVVLTATPPTVLMYNVTSLMPFFEYNFTVQACTSVGCVESPVLTTRTLEDVAEGLPSLLVSFIGGRVLVTWTTPTSPNGIIAEYRIERATPPNANVSLVGRLAEEPFVIADISTRPFTQYLYRLLVENGAGVAIGPFTSFTTPQDAPEDVFPPVLTTLSSTAVQVTFTTPLTPNGIITTYTITRLTPLTTFTFTPESLPNRLTLNDTALTPFTSYTYTLEVCTEGGCTTSDPASARTFEDMPTGVAMPTVTTVSSEELLVTWREPDMPNGEILTYDLLRKFVGFELSTNTINCCEQYLSIESNPTAECEYVTTLDSNDTSFADSELRPFTYYQYCIVVSNNADSAFSEESTPTKTDPAPMPLAGPMLNATTINSTAIELSWSSVSIEELLGPLLGYTLFGRVADSSGLGTQLFAGDGRSFVADGLIASTEYVFMVAVSNGEGLAFSNNATAVTEEGIPANLAAPLVEALSDTSLSITFSEPEEPNGVIVLYSVYLDSAIVRNATAPGTVTLTGLTPYTVYVIRVEACTLFGCTFSDLVAKRTLEGVPSGLASPLVTITGPSSANITWSPPNQPNGVITEYQLLQFTLGSSESTLVFSGIGFAAAVLNLRPFTTYNFQVIALNGAGNVTSVFTRRTTDEAPPSFTPPPTVSVHSATEILVSWEEPDELNGILIGYRLYRDGMLVSSTLQTSHSDSSLEPATTYSYGLEACTNGGCTNSSLVSNTTLEALPVGVADPAAVNIGPRSVTVEWVGPTRPNGVITEYMLTLTTNGTVVFRGLAFNFELSSLTPFTNYSFTLKTCNSVGCVQGAPLALQTLEDEPEGLDAPRLRNLTSTEVAIEWSPPSAPNGEITSYILRRGNESFPSDPIIIFQGLSLSFNDGGLLADTLYFYTVEAVNGAGSVTSPPSDFQTVPDLPGGVSPPTVVVQSATEILVSWLPPNLPNGDISGYTLFINGNPISLGIAFQYTARDLSPFTVYSFYFEVCNQAGCASSVTVTVVTDQAPATGVSRPTLAVLGPTSIQVIWTPPQFPNGVISRYEVFRRLSGNPFTETIQHSGDPSVLSFTNIGLTPYTSYEYRLSVINGAGPSLLREYVSGRTAEDIPAGVSIPMFADSDVFSRNVTASWLPPSVPNGIVVNYRLEYRILIDPTTNLPGAIIVVDTYPADVTRATAVGLLPVTTYEFRVVAINGAGEGRGEFEAVTTGEDIPEGVQPIMVASRTGTSLLLSWNSPLSPNGQIREYILYLNGGIVHRSALASVTLQGLQPFTSYSLQLAACTSAGCGFGQIQSITTATVTPAGQPAPNATALSARSVQITWSPPSRPNGFITRYEVLRQDAGDTGSLVTLLSTSDTLTRSYLDTTVRPATGYEYAIRAINDVGTTLSNFEPIRLPEARPEGVPAPVLSVLGSSSISLSWTPPTLPNGVIQTYRVLRSGGGAVNSTVYDNRDTMFVDSLLSPFTLYSYSIEACTLAGCTAGPSSGETTSEATPTDLSPPTLAAVSESTISIVWTPPGAPNGIIQSYTIGVSPGNVVVVTTDLSRVITNLLPYTLYTVSVEACNSVGCVQSSGQVRTLESLPQFLRPPTLTALNATAVEAMWVEPSRPNGVIVRYVLRRDGSVTFDGNELNFVDTGLSPTTLYLYTLQAFTSAGGSGQTDHITVSTLSDTPEDISPPLTTPISSTAVQVTWTPPGRPNGVIQRYVLLLNGGEVFSGFAFEFTADSGLQPFTRYTFQLMVCTTTCGESSEVTETTLEAPPTGQASPNLLPYRNTTVDVTWAPPSTPNGIIVSYLVERRLSPAGPFVLLANQSALRLFDQDPLLRPAATYEYRVSAINTAGSQTSDPRNVMLFEAAPEGIPDILVTSVTALSVSVTVLPPSSPNGILVSYSLYRNGFVDSSQTPGSQTATLSFTSSNLDPFTRYSFYVEVCTSGGCGQSTVTDITTLEATPTGQAPPQATVLSASSIQLTWTPPTQPNGVIQGYSLWFRTACPSPPQPLLSLPPCQVGPRSLIFANQSLANLFFDFSGSGLGDPRPYTSYQFIVGAVNNVGAVQSVYSSSVTTLSSAPEALQAGLSFSKNDESGVISLDWSEAFQFNGEFVTSSVTRNGILLVQRPITSLDLTNEPRGIPLTYVIRVVTRLSDGEAEATVTQTTQLDVAATPAPPNMTTPTLLPPTPTDVPFYQQAAFIVGMIVLGLVLLFLLFVPIVCILVRPRGDAPYKSSSPSELGDLTSNSRRYSRMQHSTPSPKHATPTSKHATPTSKHDQTVSPKHAKGSWSPGDPYTDGGIPEYSPDDQGVVITPRRKKYSPHRKMQSDSLIENDHLQLPDTVISSHVSPSQFVPAKDDFGSYRAQHTTFTDTQV